MSSEETEKAKIYLDLAQKTESGIQQSIQHLNEKIRNMLTLVSALIPTVAGLGYFIAQQTSAYWILYFVFFTLLCFVFSMVIGIGLFTKSKYSYFDPQVTIKKYGKKSSKYVYNKSASTLCDISNINAKVLNSKFNRIDLMNKALIVGLAILSLSFLFLAIVLTNTIPYVMEKLNALSQVINLIF